MYVLKETISLSNVIYNKYDVFKGPPGRPEGPLEVSDVKKDRALVSWNKPKDDGGNEIT